MASSCVDDRICDSGSEYGDAEDTINTSQNTLTPSDKKRKGSPLADNPIKKINSLPDISKLVGKEKKKAPPKSFSENLKLTLHDPTLNQTISPVLFEMLTPLIQETIRYSIDSAILGLRETILQPILDNNQKLQDSINKQNIKIEEQRNIIIEQGKELSVNKDIITELEAENRLLSAEIDDLKIGLNDLEQYGRRNSLRFHNLDMDLSLKEGEMIHSLVGFINNTILTNEEKISDNDIERCHPIGKKVGTRKPQIIVKFTSYKTRAKVFANKTKLKGHPNKTFLTEDLTSKNHTVIKSLLELRKAKRINSFWTSNGKILAKVSPEAALVTLDFTDDISQKLGIRDSDE